jgi:hypothetical protein
MNVSIAPGTVAVPLQAGQGAALCRWDAAEVVTLAAAPPSGQSRIDLVIAQVRDNALDAGGNNDFIFASVTGTPASANPAVPTTPPNALVLYQVLVPGAVANLNTATLTDVRSLTLATMDRPAGRLRMSAAQGPYTSGLSQVVATDTADFLRGNMVQSGAGLVVPVTGVYLVAVSAAFSSTAGGAVVGTSFYFNVGLMRNGTTGAAFVRQASGGIAGYPYVPSWSVTDLIVCNAGDKLNLGVLSNMSAYYIFNPVNQSFISAVLMEP